MNRFFPIITFLLIGLCLLSLPQEAQSGEIYIRAGVGFDPEAQIVGGISGTYITYDLIDYYDPWVEGKLSYENPHEQIDQATGEGINHSIDSFVGQLVDFTTSDYRPNKQLCTNSDHRLRVLSQPLPLQWFDPYQIDMLTPIQHTGSEYFINISSLYSNYFAPRPLIPVGLLDICLQTPTVQSVTFETINSPVTTDNPQSLGGGSRIFPDKATSGDQTNRRIVRVKANLEPYIPGGHPVEKAKVYFKNFDIDDPSTDTIIDDNNNAGNDNRGERDANGNWTPQSAGQLSIPSGATSCPSPPNSGMICIKTDVNGLAIVDFTVTKQPGDNFMIVASTDSTYLSGITVNGTGLQDSSNNQIQTSSGRARRSDMLSVWRKLHIEVDSMGVVQNNYVEGTIADEVRIAKNQTVTITLTTNNITLQPNRFEGGRLVVGSDSLYVPTPCAFNDNCNSPNTVTVKNTSNATIFIPANSSFTLYDDDDFNNNDGVNVDGDSIGNENITMPDICLIQGENMPTWSNCSPSGNGDSPATNVFAPAYVRPIYDIGDNNDNVNLVVNYTTLSNSEYITNLYDFDQIATEASSDFWTVYLLGSYQSIISQDGDPFYEQTEYGHVDALSLNGKGASIFIEANRAKEYPSDWQSRPVSQAHTVAHEIGHLFDGRHEDGDLMYRTFERENGNFSSITLAKIRKATHP